MRIRRIYTNQKKLHESKEFKKKSFCRFANQQEIIMIWMERLTHCCWLSNFILKSSIRKNFHSAARALLAQPFFMTFSPMCASDCAAIHFLQKLFKNLTKSVSDVLSGSLIDIDVVVYFLLHWYWNDEQMTVRWLNEWDYVCEFRKAGRPKK